MAEERRKAVRIKKQLTAQYHDLSVYNAWVMADVRDFSEAGLVVAVQKVFAPGAPMRFRIKVPLDPFKWYEFDAKVISCENNLVRAEFTDVSVESLEMIRKYVAWHLSKIKVKNEQQEGNNNIR